MSQTTLALEIFLHQGEVYFGDRDTRIRTVLGSCVAITMWHPELLVGGMCHFMLPSRHQRPQAIRAHLHKPLDGRYADEAIQMMLGEIRRTGSRARDFHIKLFGGGNMFPGTTKPCEGQVGTKNVQAVRLLLARHDLEISAEHLGGAGHRNLIFDVGTGHVWMRHKIPTYSPCDDCEVREKCHHA
ncbi:MAG: hypothetical protein RLZ81_555 [Pseudomonadota bacterium]|jgi:chemotaxis protein CheD